MAIFIDGDFWHGRNFAKDKNRLPKKYWREKIGTNILRDKKKGARLKRKGWKILRLWESDILKDEENALSKIISFLDKNIKSKI